MARLFGVVPEHGEPHGGGLATRLNWLRAAVLGANDGVVSTAGLVVGVAGATASRSVILTAGLAGLFAGALAMAVGEYVSVSSQRESERAVLALERRELTQTPEPELAELAGLYQAKGLTPELARQVAEQLSAHDALAAHAEAELASTRGSSPIPGMPPRLASRRSASEPCCHWQPSRWRRHRYASPSRLLWCWLAWSPPGWLVPG